MSAALEFSWDSRDLDIWRGGKVEFALARAIRLAGNQAARGMKKDSIQRIQAKKIIRSDDVANGLPLIFPGTRTEIKEMYWRMNVSGKPVPLGRFPVIDTRKKGVLVRVNVSGGTKRLRQAFVATLRSGHRGVFMRKGKARLPIRELFTSRLSDTMKDDGVIPAVQAAAYDRMQTAFERGLKRELRKLRTKGEA